MTDDPDAAARAEQRAYWAKALTALARQQRTRHPRKAAPRPKAGMTRIRQEDKDA